MQADNARDPARGITNRGKTFYFNKEERKIRQRTPEERGRSPGFQRSTWKKGDPPGSGGSAPDKPKRVYPSRSTPPRKGPTRPRQGNKVFRQMSDQEKESLKAQGKCLICKESGHYARDCPKKENNKHSLPAGESEKTLATKNTIPRIKTLAKYCSTRNHETPT